MTAQFEGFLEFLRWLSKLKPCLGCLAGDGWGDCPIRKCAKGKGVRGCFECGDYPCSLVERFPKFKECTDRIRSMGLDKYIGKCLKG